MIPQRATLVGLATQTTSGTSANLTLPSASSYRFVVRVNTVSGTSPTLQVVFSTSFDEVNYDEILATQQLTTTGQGQQILFRPYLGIGDVATTANTALLGTTTTPIADLGTSAVVNNGPIHLGFFKVRWIVLGTSPSFAFTVGYLAVPQDLSD
jgi:hypothetical protein